MWLTSLGLLPPHVAYLSETVWKCTGSLKPLTLVMSGGQFLPLTLWHRNMGLINKTYRTYGCSFDVSNVYWSVNYLVMFYYFVCQNLICVKAYHTPFINALNLGKIAVILRTTFSCTYSWTEIFMFWLYFYWNSFPMVQLTQTPHWFGWWPGNKHAKSNNLDNVPHCYPFGWGISWVPVNFPPKGPIIKRFYCFIAVDWYQCLSTFENIQGP